MRRPLLSGIVGLAVAAILVVGLLTVVGFWPAGTETRPVRGIDWQPVIHGPAVKFIEVPHLAVAGGRLYMVGYVGIRGSDGYSNEVWASADGTAWERVSERAFEDGFHPYSMSDDGHGGLVVVGGSSSGPSGNPSPEAWHSTDGRIWTRADAWNTETGPLISVASRPGTVIAVGSLLASLGARATAGHTTADQVVVWISGDGKAWEHVILPDSTDYTEQEVVTAWRSGFVVVAVGPSGSSTWTSVDGLAWEKAPTNLTNFSPSAICSLGDRVVTVGSKSGDFANGGGYYVAPVAWSSTDGRTWAESIAPTRLLDFSFDDIVDVGGGFVAIGSSLQGTDGAPGVKIPRPPAGVWTSSDGMTWRLLAENPLLKFRYAYDTHIAYVDGRVVVVTFGSSADDIYVGNLTR